MEDNVTSQDFSSAVSAAIENPWAYIGANSGISSLFAQQTATVLQEASQLATGFRLISQISIVRRQMMGAGGVWRE